MHGKTLSLLYSSCVPPFFPQTQVYLMVQLDLKRAQGQQNLFIHWCVRVHYKHTTLAHTAGLGQYMYIACLIAASAQLLYDKLIMIRIVASHVYTLLHTVHY